MRRAWAWISVAGALMTAACTTEGQPEPGPREPGRRPRGEQVSEAERVYVYGNLGTNVPMPPALIDDGADKLTYVRCGSKTTGRRSRRTSPEPSRPTRRAKCIWAWWEGPGVNHRPI